MATQDKLSVGVFDQLEKAQNTIDELRQHGFRADEIGIIGHVGEEPQAISTPLAMKRPEQNVTRGLCIGAAFGAVVGALVLFVIPGLAWVNETGRWFEIVGGAILGAAVGGILFAISGLVFSRAQGRLLERELEHGRFIVTVKNPQRRQEALKVLGREAVHSESA